jgi:hypothetical protein
LLLLKGTAATEIALAAPAWPKIDGPATSSPAGCGYSIALIPPCRKMNLSLGLSPEKRLMTSCTVLLVAELFSHWRISTGRWVPVGPAFSSDEEATISPPERTNASRSVRTPSQGSAHCRSTVRVSPAATVTANRLSVAPVGSKSMQWVPLKPERDETAAGQAPESRKEGASQEEISLPLESKTFSLPVALR